MKTGQVIEVYKKKLLSENTPMKIRQIISSG